jgi:hypothetical protein
MVAGMAEKPLTLDKAIGDARATAEMTRKDGHPDVAEVWDQFVGWLEELKRARALLQKSVRVEMVDFPGDPMVMGDVEHGCRFIVGEDHVIAEWRGYGIASDTVFVEDTALTYFETTTPLDRCVRMVLEMCHWEVASAMLAGPGDGELVEWAERYPHGLNGDDDE